MSSTTSQQQAALAQAHGSSADLSSAAPARTAHLECRVHAGPQAGARTPLPQGSDAWELHVGPVPTAASSHRDLMLLDRAAARLRVAHDDDDPSRLQLCLIDGDARLASMALEPGITAPWPMYGLLHVGETTLSWGSELQAAWPAHDHDEPHGVDDVGQQGDAGHPAPSAALPAADARPTEGPRASGASDDSTAEQASPRAPSDRVATQGLGWPARLAITGMALVVGSAMLMGFLHLLGFGKAPLHPSEATQVLVERGYDRLDVRSEGDRLVITGPVASEEHRRELEQLIAKRQWPARLDVTVPSLRDLVTRVFEKDLGIQPKRIDVNRGGQIEIYTQSHKLVTAADVEHAKAVARNAIPALTSLEIHNTLPAATSSCGKTAPNPGDRPTMVVWDPKRPLLFTADGKSFAIGSMLPSNHRLHNIDRDAVVTLDCDGQLSTLQL